MPILNIYKLGLGGVYYRAQVMDTLVQYDFVGNTAEESYESVKLLKSCMAEGKGAVYANVAKIFKLEEGDTQEALVSTLFEDCRSFAWLDDVLLTVDAEVALDAWFAQLAEIAAWAP